MDLPAVPNVGAFNADPGALIGDGESNTTAILSAGNCPTHTAALACVNYMGGSHNDWHLPSIQELISMRDNIGIRATGANMNIGQFEEAIYVSSSELDDDQAWFLRFEDVAGLGLGSFFKNSGSFRVRPIRAF